MAKFFIRQTAQGNEYWDNIDKNIIFIPVGQEIDFEVEDDSKSRIAVDEIGKQGDETFDINSVDVSEADSFNFEMASIKELREYAETNGIEIPVEIKKKMDIIKFLKGDE